MANKDYKKLLVIAPHGDDEINLLGTVADRFTKNKWNIHLLLITNGDYLPKVTEKRHAETEAVAKEMGISKITYLGYGDDPAFSGTHTYHTKAPESCTTPAGHSCTYSVADPPEHAFLTHGIHRPYCRNSVKEDMKECILAEKAEVIVCVDLDEHADHRMTSLLFDEILRELIRTTQYRPIVLKKFAYAGVWFGPEDYYANPMAETRLTPEEYFPYSPEQGIRVRVSRKYYPVFYKRSPVYKLCEIYQSQYVTEHFTRMINADALYFFRDCSNLAISAQIQVSSGEGHYLNDGKLADFYPVNKENSLIVSDYEAYTWIPAANDPTPWAVFRFDQAVAVQEIHLHLPYQEEYRPKKIKITTKSSTIEKVLSPGNDLRALISFDQPITNIREFSLQILEGTPGKCGIREVEIFDHHSAFPWDRVPLKQYNPKSLRYRPGSTAVPKFQKKLNTIKMFLRYDLRNNGIRYYLSRLLQKFKR